MTDQQFIDPQKPPRQVTEQQFIDARFGIAEQADTDSLSPQFTVEWPDGRRSVDYFEIVDSTRVEPAGRPRPAPVIKALAA